MRRIPRRSVLGLISTVLGLVIACLVLSWGYPYTYAFPAFPRITHTQAGAAGDPINVLFLGTPAQIQASFHQAGWLIPDPITLQTSAEIVAASLAHKSYPTAPISQLYVFGRGRIWPLKSPLLMSNTVGIFVSGRPRLLSEDIRSGWPKPPMMLGLN